MMVLDIIMEQVSTYKQTRSQIDAKPNSSSEFVDLDTILRDMAQC